MQPNNSFGERTIELIRKHSGVFEALLEFERTKKLPKTVYRERIDITLDGNLLREFRRYCREHGFNMSRLIEHHIREEFGKKSGSFQIIPRTTPTR